MSLGSLIDVNIFRSCSNVRYVEVLCSSFSCVVGIV